MEPIKKKVLGKGLSALIPSTYVKAVQERREAQAGIPVQQTAIQIPAGVEQIEISKIPAHLLLLSL